MRSVSGSRQAKPPYMPSTASQAGSGSRRISRRCAISSGRSRASRTRSSAQPRITARKCSWILRSTSKGTRDSRTGCKTAAIRLRPRRSATSTPRSPRAFPSARAFHARRSGSSAAFAARRVPISTPRRHPMACSPQQPRGRDREARTDLRSGDCWRANRAAAPKRIAARRSHAAPPNQDRAAPQRRNERLRGHLRPTQIPHRPRSE
jgi:hypothetical protein